MIKRTALFLLSLPLLLSCTTVADTGPKGIAAFKDDPRLGEPVSKICFKRNIDGFSNATRDTVVLSAGVNDDYIVEVFGSCTNLRRAQSIAIDSNLSCVSDGDFLIVSESVFPSNDRAFDLERCAIDKIYKWDKRATAKDAEEIDDDS
ncbi:MAG: hypothetical protein EX271_09985 [Acidimicrobiales bacterium]|nr:hypothetical protein [Hyphomonadaceae bacterium]RZV40602.1 MAG: hypothetical protein EX271_09985 [Acidimicrobiales bacterium]